MPAIVSLRSVQQLEVLPGGSGTYERHAGKHQAPFACQYGVLPAADPAGPDQRDQNRGFKPGKVQFSHDKSSSEARSDLARSDSRDGPPERKSVQIRSRASNQRKTRRN